MYNHTLAQYNKRKVLIGLSGRLADRLTFQSMALSHTQFYEELNKLQNKKDVELFMQTTAGWKAIVQHYLQNQSLPAYQHFQNPEKIISLICSVPNWKEIMFLSEDYQMPAAVIEEIENKEEVENVLRSFPHWKPIVHYFSQNPDLQNKYPVLNHQRLLSFLYKHQIGAVVCSLTDHETDRFIQQYKTTSIAQKLLGRQRIENELIDMRETVFVSDCPQMFAFLTSDRLKELKTSFYQRLNYIHAYAQTLQELKEARLFTHYLVESLDGRNLKTLDKECNLDTEIIKTTVSHTLRESELVSKIKKLPTASARKQVLKENITESVSLIEQALFNTDSKTGCAQIRSAMDQIKSDLPEIKQQSRKTQQGFYLIIRKAIRLLNEKLNDSHIKTGLFRFYSTTATALNQMILSNGEQAFQRQQEQKQKQGDISERNKIAENQARIRSHKKEEAHLNQHQNNILKQQQQTPEEIEQKKKEKWERRQKSKMRKILRNKLKYTKKNNLPLEALSSAKDLTSSIEEKASETPVETKAPKEVVIVHRFKQIKNEELYQLIQNTPARPFYIDLLSDSPQKVAVNRYGVMAKNSRKGKNRSRE